MSHSALIELKKIKKIFSTADIDTWALDDVDLDINTGEFVSITGQSGCGKSTLLSVLGLLSASTEGDYFLDGINVKNLNNTAQAKVRNRQIGFIFQAFNLIPDMSVAENVEVPLTYRSEINSADRNTKVLEALDKVDMAHRSRHYPGQLSGGQQQRVAIARALAGSPKVLLADEPTGNLDSNNADSVMSLLDSLHRQGSTICMVTHDLELARKTDRQITLFDGKIVDDQVISR